MPPVVELNWENGDVAAGGELCGDGKAEEPELVVTGPAGPAGPAPAGGTADNEAGVLLEQLAARVNAIANTQDAEPDWL